MSCLAVVTARGGSKAVPNKNLRTLHGRPLIAYAIEVALASSRVTRVVVTTDSPEIRDLAIGLGAEAPFLRPAELASDSAKQEDAILHAMEWYERHDRAFEMIVLMQPTFPLRSVETVDRAFATLSLRPDASALLSVVPCEPSPVWCNELRTDGLMGSWMDPRSKRANRQELAVTYRPSGLVAISEWLTFKSELSFLHDRTLSFPVDAIESWDIDEPVDLFVAERLLAAGLRSSRDVDRLINGALPDGRLNPSM